MSNTTGAFDASAPLPTPAQGLPLTLPPRASAWNRHLVAERRRRGRTARQVRTSSLCVRIAPRGSQVTSLADRRDFASLDHPASSSTSSSPSTFAPPPPPPRHPPASAPAPAFADPSPTTAAAPAHASSASASAGASLGGRVRGVFDAIHGAGEALRGNINAAVDGLGDGVRPPPFSASCSSSPCTKLTLHSRPAHADRQPPAGLGRVAPVGFGPGECRAEGPQRAQERHPRRKGRAERDDDDGLDDGRPYALRSRATDCSCWNAVLFCVFRARRRRLVVRGPLASTSSSRFPPPSLAPSRHRVSLAKLSISSRAPLVVGDPSWAREREL